MKFRNILICVYVLLVCMLGIGDDFEDYQKLKTENVSSIRMEDLPSEFSDEAFKTVDEFIKKTRNLDYEFVVYFDYVTGEILKCAKGIKNNVKITFEDGEFEGHHVASIHNHSKYSLSAPSGINFGIFDRPFEDYELVAGFSSFWILEAKGVYKGLSFLLNICSDDIADSCLELCVSRYSDDEIINKMHDIIYGSELLKYINDKIIYGIQLTKKEYVTMDNAVNTIGYSCRKLPTHEEIELARKRVADPTILTGKDRLYALYKMLGFDVEYDEIFAD